MPKKEAVALLSLSASCLLPREIRLAGRAEQRESLSAFLAARNAAGTPAPAGVLLYAPWKISIADNKEARQPWLASEFLGDIADLRSYLQQKELPFLAIGGAAALALQELALHVAGIAPTAARSGLIEDLFYRPETAREGQYSALQILPESRLAPFYGEGAAAEWHAHGAELNPAYQWPLIQAGLRYAGSSEEGVLVDCLEAREGPFAVYAMYEPWTHPTTPATSSRTACPRPAMGSRPAASAAPLHPLLQAFLAAADGVAGRAKQGGENDRLMLQ